MKTTPQLLISVGLTMVFASTTIPARAQATAEQGDAKIASLLGSIMKGLGDRDKGDYNEEALNKANDAMRSYMETLCSNPVFLTAKLKKAKDAGLGVTSSPDKELRIYSWDTQTGGTMHFYNTLAQYRPAPGSTKTKSLDLLPPQNKDQDGGDPGLWYTGIHQMKCTDGTTIYLAFAEGTFSNMDHSAVIQAYEIKNGTLKRAAVFKTKTKTLDEIACGFHAGNGDDITLNEKAKKLSVPLLKGDDGVPTGKYLVYVFDGQKFVYKNIERGSKKPDDSH